MRPLSLSLALLSTIAILACSESKKATGGSDGALSSLDTAVVDYKSKNPQTVFFDLSTGEKVSVPLHSWDLSIHTSSGAIHANGGLYGSGVLLYKTQESDIDADLSTLRDSVKQIQTSKSDPFQHEISADASGSDTVYLIRDAEGNFLKLKFESFGIQGKYTLKMAKGLAGKASELTGSMTLEQGYVWLDLSEAKDVSELFPQTSDWDLCFTRGLEEKQFAGPSADSMVIAQSVIYLNKDNNVTGAISEESDFNAITSISDTNFTQAFDDIGAGWYNSNYDPQTHISNPTVKDQVYLIQVGDNEFHKVQFLSFFGPNQESFVTVFKYGGLE